MFHQVPVLPVVVPIAVVTFVALLSYLRRRERLSIPRAAVALALCVYVAGVVANTVFPIFLDKPTYDAPWYESITVEPLVGYGVADALMNVIVFAPLGILVPLLMVRASTWRVLAVAGAFSLLIEVSQYVNAHLSAGGHVADVNDLTFNVVGAALGYGALCLLVRVPAAEALVDRFRWHPGSSPRRELLDAETIPEDAR